MANTKKINNIQDLTFDLVKTYEDLQAGRITTDKSKEVSRVAGRIIGASRTQMEYNAQMKNKKHVKFLNV